MLSCRSRAFAAALVLALYAPTGAFSAAPAAATGLLQGRVQDATTGEFLERVRVSAMGRETFTDTDGYYRLGNLPAGEIRVEAFYTGLAVQTFTVAVPPGGAAERDLALSTRAAAGSGAAVQLSEFVVATSREMSGAARAINEQRFAPNLRTVLSADEFGDIAENNVGEFMKFMPGVNIEHSGGNARDVSLNGVPGAYVPITVDGFTLANATGDGAGGTGRAVALDTVSINNLSRVEVTFSPTPESPGAALAGTVNFVPRSAFERTKPVFSFSANLTMREDAREWHETPGPRENTRKVHPGGDFSYVVPVNKRFGFTVAGGFSKVYSGAPSLNAQWRGSQLPTNGAAFPHTTADRPYLTSFAVANSSKQSDRTSFSATVDYKLTSFDRLSFSFQTSTFGVQTDNNVLTFGITGVTAGNFSLASTRSNPGAGTITLGGSGATRTNLTYMPSLIWRHDGPIWKSEAGFAHSRSNNRSRNGGSGVGEYFGATTVTRTGLTVAFSGISALGPDAIAVADAAGNVVNPYALDSYVATTASRTIRQTDDTQRTAYAKVRRDFYGAVPLSLRTGLDFREGTRDQRFSTPAFTYLGADGVAGNTALAPAVNDNRASPFLDPFASRWVGPYRINTFDAFSPNKFYEHYLANPAQFATNANATYRSEVTNSKRARELVSAGYLRGDLQFFANRLKVVGGVRAEQTNIDAEGPLSEPSRNLLRDPAGHPVVLNGRTQPVTTDPLAASRLTYLDRGARSQKEYLRFFPSLNASYNLRENLIVRAAYSTSIGRPDYNQYAGGLTLPDPENPQPSDQIVVSNVAIKPWRGRSFNARIEYYLPGVGQISLGGFRRDLEDFHGSTIFPATPEFLALYNLDPAIYGAYPVATQHNLDTTVRLQGFDVSYKQALTFLPPWARGLQVFANTTVQRLLGPASANFPGFIPRTANWGVSLTRNRYVLRANWNYRSNQRRNAVAAGNGIEPGTFIWWSDRLYFDINAEYRFYGRLSFYASLRNVRNVPEDVEIFGPNTPAVARFRSRAQWGSLWVFGVKGTF